MSFSPQQTIQTIFVVSIFLRYSGFVHILVVWLQQLSALTHLTSSLQVSISLFNFHYLVLGASFTVYNNPPTLCSRQTSRLTPSFISEAIDRPISPPSTATKFSTMCNRINQYKFSPAREVHAAPYQPLQNPPPLTLPLLLWWLSASPGSVLPRFGFQICWSWYLI